MTVKELIEQLQAMPQDLQVFGAVEYDEIYGVRVQTEGDWPVERDYLPIVLLCDSTNLVRDVEVTLSNTLPYPLPSPGPSAAARFSCGSRPSDQLPRRGPPARLR